MTQRSYGKPKKDIEKRIVVFLYGKIGVLKWTGIRMAPSKSCKPIFGSNSAMVLLHRGVAVHSGAIKKQLDENKYNILPIYYGSVLL
jgi:hypothetical protein